MWLLAVGSALAALGAWWHMRSRVARFERLLADTEESRYALEVQTQAMVARLEAMSQVMAAQQRAIDAAMNRTEATPSTLAALGIDPPDTVSPSTVPSVLQRAAGKPG